MEEQARDLFAFFCDPHSVRDSGGQQPQQPGRLEGQLSATYPTAYNPRVSYSEGAPLYFPCGRAMAPSVRTKQRAEHQVLQTLLLIQDIIEAPQRTVFRLRKHTSLPLSALSGA